MGRIPLNFKFPGHDPGEGKWGDINPVLVMEKVDMLSSLDYFILSFRDTILVKAKRENTTKF